MIGVYGLPKSRELRACFTGLSRLFQRVVWRNHNVFRPDGDVENFEFVVVSGLRSQGEVIRNVYNSIGVRCVVIDYGYLRRVNGVRDFETGHWQVGVDRLGWLCPDEMPADRFDRLGIELKPGPRDGRAVYVCGQHAGDPSHGLDAKGIAAWARGAMRAASETTDKPVIWRPHPDSPVEIEGAATSAGPLDWRDVHRIVTINSNIGNEALIEGVRVSCAPSASYAYLAGEPYPDHQKRLRHFHRLAYSQWTLAEIETGEPFRFLAENHYLEKST